VRVASIQWILSDGGNSSVTVLSLILLISALFLSAGSVGSRSLSEARKTIESLDRKTEEGRIVDEIIKRFEDDPTPESHYSGDPVWTYISEYDGPFGIELADASSKLNINWIRTKLFEETDMSVLIQDGYSAESIRTRRNEIGFVTRLIPWTDEFGEENLNRYFTVYSWPNVNVTYEESLEMLYRQRHGDGGASLFRNKIQNRLRAKGLWSEEELPLLFGVADRDLKPVMNTRPQMNVHFVDPLILKSLLSYPYLEDPLGNPLLIARSILDARETEEINPDKLRALISPNENQMRVLQYLGTVTDFWEIRLSDSKGISSNYIIFYNGEGWGRLN
jgi:hypothetical protein